MMFLLLYVVLCDPVGFEIGGTLDLIYTMYYILCIIKSMGGTHGMDVSVEVWLVSEKNPISGEKLLWS